MKSDKEVPCEVCGIVMARCRTMAGQRCFECKKRYQELFNFEKKRLIRELNIPNKAASYAEEQLLNRVKTK